MGLQKFTIHKYVRTDRGWRYCRPAFARNNQIKPNVGMVQCPSERSTACVASANRLVQACLVDLPPYDSWVWRARKASRRLFTDRNTEVESGSEPNRAIYSEASSEFLDDSIAD